MLKKLILLSSTLLFTTISYSQETLEFKENIQEIKAEPFSGNLIVKTKDGISSINTQTNKVEWTVETSTVNNATTMSKLSKISTDMNNNDFLSAFSSTSEIQSIANSPFIQVVFDNNQVILDGVTGNVVFNAAELGYKILSTNFIASEKQLLILGEKDKNIEFVNFNLINKSTNWTSNVGSVDNLAKQLGKVFKSMLSGEVSMADDKVLVYKNNILVCLKGILFNLNVSDGKVNWKTDYPINNFYINRDGNKVITILNSGKLLSIKQGLNILDIKDGSKVWKEDITTKFITYLEDQGDKLLVAHHSGFNFFNYASGEKVWKKDAKGKVIKKVIPIDQDYLYIADTEMNLVDKDGKSKWKNFIEIAEDSEDEVYYLGTAGDNRVFYLTDTYGNMVDYTSGKKIWKKNVEFDKKRPLVYTIDGDKFLVYNNKRIYTFNANNTDSPKPKGKVDVENDKTIQSIEAFDWGVCIVGQNDVIGLDNEGNTIYQNSYKEPGEAGRRLAKTGAIIGSGLLNTSAGVKSALASATVVYRDEQGNVISEQKLLSEESSNKLNKAASNESGVADLIDKTVLAKFNKRFDGLKQNSDFAFVLAKGESGAELIKVRKKDGKELAKIQLNSNKPIYEIDPFDSKLYYGDGKTLKIYKSN